VTEDDNLHEDLQPRDNAEGLSRFEIEARKWAAIDKLLAMAREATRQYDLDPDLLEAVEDACRQGDVDYILEAMVALWEASI